MAVSKPLAGTRIDPASPWARGLVFAAPFNEGGGARVANYAPQFQQIAGAGTALSYVGSPQGGALKTNGSTSRATFPTFPGVNVTGPVTVAMRVRPDALANANISLYASNYPGSSGGNVFVGFNTGGAGNQLWFYVNGFAGLGARTSAAFSTAVWVDILCEWNGTTARIEINGVGDTVANGSGARGTGSTSYDIGCLNITGTPSRFVSAAYEYLFHWEGRTFTAAEKAALRANPWQLWPDEPQLVFAPVTTFTGTATSSQAQTSAATGLAGNIGTATASQAQTTNATGLAGVIGTATSSQAQSATGAGAETYNGNATSSQAQTAEAVGIAGVIGTATTSQAQTSDAIGVAGIVGTATSSQAQTVNGAGNNGQLSVQFGGHIAQPQYIHVPMFARGTGKATCKSKPHVRVLTRALAIGRSKGTCRPLVRQYMTGRAVGASVPVISSMRLQYNETWHAQRARDDQSLLFGF